MAKNQSFVDAVRKEDVTQPQQRSFCLKEWTEQYQNFPESRADGRLHEAGLWFDREFSAIRSALNQLPELSTVANVRALVAFNNFEMTRAMNLPRDHLSENKFVVHEEFDRLEPLGPWGTPVNRQAYIEAMVSSLTLPLRFLIRGRSIGNPKADSENTIAELMRHVQLAATYAQLETLWLECLWNGWYIDTASDVVIRSGDLRHHANCAVGAFRGGVLMSEKLIHLMQCWSDPAFQDIKAGIIARSRHIEVNRKGRLKVYPLRRARAKLPRALDVNLLVAEERYWRELMTRPLPNMKDVTIRQVLEAWRVMMEIGESLQGLLNTQQTVTSVGSLVSGHGHKLKRADLLKALGRVDPSKSALFLEHFTFDGRERIDPWLHPLLQIGEEYVVIVSSLNHSNPVRLVEHWMAVGGLDLGERGKLFEQHVHTSVAAACRSSRFSPSCEVATAGLEFTPCVDVPVIGETKEQIDLAFRLGGTVLICEDKCCVYPVEPRDRYHYFKRIRIGREQVSRKAKFVRAHLSEFMRLYFPAYREDISAVRVVPLVITNLAFGSGSRSADSVPVADLVMLTRYLDEGVFTPHAEFSLDDGLKPQGKPTPLYRTKREFENNIVPFVSEPPLINGYRNALLPKLTYMQLGDGRLQPVETLNVDPEHVKRQVRNELTSWTRQHCRDKNYKSRKR